MNVRHTSLLELNAKVSSSVGSQFRSIGQVRGIRSAYIMQRIHGVAASIQRLARLPGLLTKKEASGYIIISRMYGNELNKKVCL